MTVNNVTIGGSSAYFLLPGHGGGIEGQGSIEVSNSIFENTPGGNISVGTAFHSLGRNIFSDAPGASLNPTDLVNTDPLLVPLAENGGPARTMAWLPGSPAVDAGVAVAGVTTDQRGMGRPLWGGPDIGAFESRGFTIAVVGGDGQTATAGAPFPSPLIVAVTSPFGKPVAGGRVYFSAPTTGASADFTGNPATVNAEGRAGVGASANGLVGAYRGHRPGGRRRLRRFDLTNSGSAATTTLLLTSGPNPSAAGLPVTFTATVAAAGAVGPTGAVLPTDVAVDAAGDMFIADFGNNRVREVMQASSIVTVTPASSSQGGDFDGDNKADPAFFDPTTATWAIRLPDGTPRTVQFGAPGDAAAPGDYQWTGTSNLAVYTPLTATWLIREAGGDVPFHFGDPAFGDQAAPADYDGKADLAVFRPSTAHWVIREADGSDRLLKFRDPAEHDVPAPGPYDGSAAAELAVYRPAHGIWVLLVDPSGGTLVDPFGDPNRDRPARSPVLDA